MSTGNNNDNNNSTTVEVSSECQVCNYVERMLLCMTCEGKKDTVGNLEKRAHRKLDLYQPIKTERSFLIDIGGTRVKIISNKELTSLHVQIIINYLLSHNGLGELNNLCFVENCSLRENQACTMKSLDKVINGKDNT